MKPVDFIFSFGIGAYVAWLGFPFWNWKFWPLILAILVWKLWPEETE